jgi:DNA-directed RNA polymerase specialized sigma24 family protein
MARDDDHEPPSGEEPAPPPRPLRPKVGDFLARPEVMRWVHKRVRAKLPEQDCEQEAQSVLQELVEKTKWPDSDEPKVLWAVVKTVCRCCIADYLEKRKTRRQYEGETPGPRKIQDEAGDYVVDEENTADPSHDPRAVEQRTEGLLLRTYLEQAVKEDARDEEVYGWMVAWSDDELTYPQIAELAGLSEDDVYKRVQRFKEKYLPRYRRWRNGMFLLLLLGAVVVCLAWWVLQQMPHRPKVEDIRPSPDVPQLAPSGSATGEPVEPPPAPEPSFNNAWPTNPDARAPDPFDDKPPRGDLKPPVR